MASSLRLGPQAVALAKIGKGVVEGKNHRRSLKLLGNVSPSPPSSARLCALLSIESGMSRKREVEGKNAILRRSGKRIVVLFLDGKIGQ